MPNVNGILDKQ